MLAVVLFAMGFESQVRGAMQSDAAKSPELEQAAKLSLDAASLFESNKFDEALATAKQALALREKVLGPNHELVASSLDGVADIYVAIRKYETAEPLYRRSLSILEKKWGPVSKYLTSTLESLALVRFVFRDNGGAEKLYLRSLAIKEKEFGPDAPATGRTLGTIGSFYERIDKPEKAVEYFKRRLVISEKELGPDNPGLIEPLYKCICVLRAANNSSEASQYQSRVDKILPPPDPVHKGAVLQGNAVVRAEPIYPIEARRRRVSGSVVVEVKVDECGRVTDARAITGHVDLVDAAVKAARQWRFSTTRLGTRPVKVIGTITFNFRS